MDGGGKVVRLDTTRHESFNDVAVHGDITVCDLLLFDE